MNAHKIFALFFKGLRGSEDDRIWHPDHRIDQINRADTPMITIEPHSRLVSQWRVTQYTPLDQLFEGSQQGFGQAIEGVPGLGLRDFIAPSSGPSFNANELPKVRLVTGANADLGWACIQQACARGIAGLAGLRSSRLEGIKQPLSQLTPRWAPLLLDNPESWGAELLKVCTKPLVLEVVNAAAYHIMDDYLAKAQENQLAKKMSNEELVELVKDFTQANIGLPVRLVEAIASFHHIKRVAWVDVGTTDTRGSTQVLTAKLAVEKDVSTKLETLNLAYGYSYSAVQAGRIATRAKALTAGAEIPVSIVAEVVEASLTFSPMYKYLRPEVTMLSSSTYQKIARNEMINRSSKPRL